MDYRPLITTAAYMYALASPTRVEAKIDPLIALQKDLVKLEHLVLSEGNCEVQERNNYCKKEVSLPGFRYSYIVMFLSDSSGKELVTYFRSKKDDLQGSFIDRNGDGLDWRKGDQVVTVNYEYSHVVRSETVREVNRQYHLHVREVLRQWNRQKNPASCKKKRVQGKTVSLQ